MKNLPSKKLVLYRTISILITLIGMALITYMITIEGELGLLPIVLLLIGTTTSIYFHIKLNRNKTHF
jgi:hypothetical protein